MPYHVTKSKNCPVSKPWATVKSSDGKVMGCHETREKALAQQRALYANDKKAK